MAVPLATPFAKRSSGQSNGDDQGKGDGKGGDEDSPAEHLEEGDRVAFSDAVRFPEQYAMDIAVDGDGESETTMFGRVYGTDQYLRTEYPGGVTESYLIDRTVYVVSDDECLQYSVSDTHGKRDGQPPRGTPRRLSDPMLEVTENTELDGRDSVVLEVIEWPNDLPEPASEARDEHAEGHGVEWQQLQAKVTYQVDVETGFMSRLETAEATIDFHAWEKVEPVSPPTMDCHQTQPPDA